MNNIEKKSKRNNPWLKYLSKEAIEDGINPSDLNEKSIQEQAEDALIDREIKHNQDVPKQISFLNMKGERGNFVPVMSEENISMVIGKSKSKKSYFTNQVIAALVSNKEIDQKVWGNMPDDRRTIVVIDTEQSKYHVARRRKIIELGASEKDFDRLKVYNFAGLDVPVIVEALQSISEMEGVGLILIDQMADLVASINNEDEAVLITREITKIVTNKKIHIVVILHQNKGNEHASGWLGSHLLKKCETVITVEKISSDKSNVNASFTRNEAFENIGLFIEENGVPKLVESHPKLDNAIE